MKRIHTLLAIGCGLLFAANTCFAQMYTVTDLGDGQAAAINDSGQVVGVGSCNGASAFRTAPNSPINPATDYLSCHFYAGALDINDSGQVVGWSELGSPYSRAFRTAPNGPLNLTDDLGTLFYTCENCGFYNNFANGINASGQAIGTSTFPYRGDITPAYRAFRTAPNSPINSATDELGSLGGQVSAARAINNFGQVVGQSATSGDSALHAFRTAPNSPINPAADDVGTLGGAHSYAYGINAFGQVVGSATTSGDTASHAFRTAPNSPIDPASDDLGTLGGTYSMATSIDNFGQVVGWSSLPGDTVQHAFLYSGGRMRDLNDLVPAGSGCEILGLSQGSVYSPDINNAGQIAANRSCSGEQQAVRLDPIYNAPVRPPIRADGSSVFAATRESVPLAFILLQHDVRSCTLLPATLVITRIRDGKLTRVRSRNLSITGCRYAYDLKPNRLGVGMYRADVSINGIMVGHAVFAIK